MREPRATAPADQPGLRAAAPTRQDQSSRGRQRFGAGRRGPTIATAGTCLFTAGIGCAILAGTAATVSIVDHIRRYYRQGPSDPTCLIGGIVSDLGVVAVPGANVWKAKTSTEMFRAEDAYGKQMTVGRGAGRAGGRAYRERVRHGHVDPCPCPPGHRAGERGAVLAVAALADLAPTSGGTRQRPARRAAERDDEAVRWAGARPYQPDGDLPAAGDPIRFAAGVSSTEEVDSGEDH